MLLGWSGPEKYISIEFAEVFTPTITSTVSSVVFITESGTISTITLKDLLTKFNAVDFAVLLEGDFLAEEPDGATQLTDSRYNNYLWLLEKDTASGSGGAAVSSRNVVVLALTKVEESATTDKFDLTYRQIN